MKSMKFLFIVLLSVIGYSIVYSQQTVSGNNAFWNPSLYPNSTFEINPVLLDSCLTTPQINFVIKQAFELKGTKAELANADVKNEVLTGYSHELNKIIYLKNQEIDLYLLQNRADKEQLLKQVDIANKSLKIQKLICSVLSGIITAELAYIKYNK